jgi:hypothetical protein
MVDMNAAPKKATNFTAKRYFIFLQSQFRILKIQNPFVRKGFRIVGPPGLEPGTLRL